MCHFLYLEVFVNQEKASTVLYRHRRYNTGRLEEVVPGNLERECMEEKCSYEEAREVFENDQKTMEFWRFYLEIGTPLLGGSDAQFLSNLLFQDGDQCTSNPCQNGGTCKDDISNYVCWCPAGYEGRNCELVPFPCGRITSPEALNDKSTRATNTIDDWIIHPNATDEDEESVNSIQIVSRKSNRTRVVGGQDSKKGEVPWQVYLRNSEGKGFCGGSIINEKWIVTAAHCLMQNVIDIVAGEHNVNSPDHTEQVRQVSRAIPHPTYNTTNMYHNDIALLELASPLELNHYVTPICLADREFTNNLLRFGLGTVSGWGRLTHQGRMASVLQVLRVQFIDRLTCLRNTRYSITPFMFCAGVPAEAKDTCQGDSGGPYATDLEGTWFLTGITSWGEQCAQKDKYGVYTRVAKYMKWIRDTTRLR
ncbi:Coagulation factor IX [Varanus komodoensis]|nr:Coagulation factor IX [Varanus komodoensis]